MVLARFGNFTLNTGTGELRRDGRPVKLHPQPAGLLSLLVQRQGSLLTREEIRDELWGDETHVDFDLGINSCVRQIRTALRDDAEHPRFVETVPRKGYRFVAPIEMGKPAAVGKARPRRLALTLLAVATAIGLLSPFFLRSRSDPVSSATRSRILTSFAGPERFPAISPNGEKVAYSWRGRGGRRTDPLNLYVQFVDGSEPLQLTSENRNDYSPAWSPDGRHIAFLREIVEPGQATMSEVRIVSALGGRERRLGSAAVRLEVGPPFNSGLDWSPDGRYLVFSDKASSREQEGIFLLSIETGEKKRLTTPPSDPAFLRDREPAFSPDGKTVAYIRGANITSYQILLQSVEGGEARHLTTEEGAVIELDWIPDGSALIYARYRRNERGLTRVSVRDGRASDLNVGGEAVSVSLSGDGRRLVYTQFHASPSNIWRAPGPASSQRADPVRLLPSSRSDWYPEYSPDGSQVAFTSFRSGPRAVWVCDAESTSCTQIAGDNAAAPRWSPDGSKIGYVKPIDGKPDLYFTSVEQGFTRRLTRAGIETFWPFAWSRDGAAIYYESHQGGESRIWRKSLEGGEAVPITRGGGSAPRESPDGKWLYFSKLRPDGDYKWVDIWKVPVEGGEEAPVLQGRLVEAPNFVLWRDMLIYRGWEGFPPTRHGIVNAYHLGTGEQSRLLTFPAEEQSFGFGLSVSPDGKWILYSKGERRNTDIVVLENFEW